MMGKIFKFFGEVKQEVSKVTWLTRRETIISTGVVLVVVIVFSLLFVLSDFLIFRFVNFVSNLRL
ncbi:MAG: preprotein translocase subunit SecE [Alphaproteobacteria bacterium]|nr:preprotein translocase subunit SecE [Alphaproteobacteria bacterium]